MGLPSWAASDQIYAKGLSGLGNIKEQIKRADAYTKSLLMTDLPALYWV